MKIYNNTSEYSITDFIGQDVWVLCDTLCLGRIFLHPIRVIGQQLKFNYIEVASMYDLKYMALRYVNDYFDTWTTEVEDCLISDIQVCVPIEICTIEDIKDYFGL